MINTSDHKSTAYKIAGQGSPILFIHGYPLSKQIWDSQLIDLGDSHQMISLDLPGHGESKFAQEPPGIEQMAEYCANFLVKMKITEKVVLCGLSMGGYVAFAFHRLFKDRLAGLILTATRSSADSREARHTRFQVIKQVDDEGIEPIVVSMTPKLLSPQTFQKKSKIVDDVTTIMFSSVTPETIKNDQYAIMNRQDSTGLLAEINYPVLIIHGRDDQIIPIQEAQLMHKAIRGAQLTILPDAGHLPNMEQPILFNQVVRNFLNNSIQ